MKLENMAFTVTDWSQIAPEEHPGETGKAVWRTLHMGPIRIRRVDYSPGYLADHWCSKGHIIFCIAGELHTELEDGRQYTLRPGMSYQVADHAEAHRSSTQTGVSLFIVD